jgi:hypothetical protein
MRTVPAPLAALVAALLAAGCSSRTAPAAAPAGKLLAEGPAQFLSASADGSRVAWLAACAPAPGAGKGQLACALRVAPVAGGAVQTVAEGLPAMDGVFAWGSGSRIAFSSAGALRIASPGVAPSAVRGGSGVEGFAFAPAPGQPLAALVRGAGGSRDLVLWRETSDPPILVARDVAAFAFSPDGAWLAAIAGVAPGRAGDLVTVPVGPAGAEGREPPSPGGVVVARAVGEFRWAPRATRLAWLAGFDPRIRAGSLASAVPGGPAVAFAPQVTAFELSPSGEQVAYVRHVTESTYAAQLELSPSQAAMPGTLAREAASFEFSPDGRWLYYRAGCAPAGDGCALFRAPAAGLAPGQSPERLADGVAGFSLDRWRPDRALVSFARRDGAGVDLALWSGGRFLSLDGAVLAGSARFLPPDGRRVAYVVSLPARAGVYLADAP